MQPLNLDGSPVAVPLRPTTIGLSATFFVSTTVNTTGTALLAANNGRTIGCYINSDTASIPVLVGPDMNGAVLKVGNTAAPAIPGVFIYGTSALYVKAASGIINVSGYWI